MSVEILETRKCKKCGSEFTVKGFQIMGRKVISSEDLCENCREIK